VTFIPGSPSPSILWIRSSGCRGIASPIQNSGSALMPTPPFPSFFDGSYSLFSALDHVRLRFRGMELSPDHRPAVSYTGFSQAFAAAFLVKGTPPTDAFFFLQFWSLLLWWSLQEPFKAGDSKNLNRLRPFRKLFTFPVPEPAHFFNLLVQAPLSGVGAFFPTTPMQIAPRSAMPLAVGFDFRAFLAFFSETSFLLCLNYSSEGRLGWCVISQCVLFPLWPFVVSQIILVSDGIPDYLN